MKKRSTDILQQLLYGKQEELKVSKLLEEYHISEKTLRSDIQEIQDFLNSKKIREGVISDGKSLHLNDKTEISFIKNYIETMDLYDYKLSLDERKFYITIALLQHDGYYSMQQLADELFVTRNTIMNDCKVVEEFLKDYDVHYLARSKKGIQITCESEAAATLLIDIFHAILPNMHSEHNFFAKYLMRKLKFTYSFSDIISHMTRYTKEHNIMFAGETFHEIAVCIFVVLNVLSWMKTSDEPMELDALGDMVRSVAEDLKCPIKKSDVLFVERMIMVRNLNPEIHSINDFELYGVISHFLLEIGREIDIDIQNDDLLIKALLSHIKNMKNWGSVEFDFDDDYSEIGLITRVRQSAEDKFYILEKYLRYQMNDNMKNSIIIHICAALYRHQELSTPCQVVVSCPGSMATSKYLEAQVRNYFNLTIVGTMTTRQVIMRQDELAKKVDFIISTVMIPECQIPVIVVSPLLTLEDINKIQSIAFKKQKEEHGRRVEEYPLIERLLLVYSLGDRKKITYLDQELKRVLEEVFRIESETAKKSALMKMLQLKYVKLVEGSLDWQDAMKTASEDLIRDGYFETTYLEKAIENVDEYGSYIIVNQGIALAHANRDAGVYKDGISLLVAKDGITFDDGETVYLMFFFSQKGETDYLDLFKEIIKLGNDTTNIQKMCQMERSSDIYQLIVEILTEYESADSERNHL